MMERVRERRVRDRESRKENRKKHMELLLCTVAEAWAWVSSPGLWNVVGHGQNPGEKELLHLSLRHPEKGKKLPGRPENNSV